MSRLRYILSFWRSALVLLICTAIAHIAFSFVMPYVFATSAFAKLRHVPLNTFVILPPARFGEQVLPFQAPDVRYALCRFDVTAGPLISTARLPEAGWTYSVYTSQGEAVYAFAAQQFTDIAIAILPPGERFVDVVSAAPSTDSGLTQIHLPTQQGIIVLRAPLRGRSYAAEIERDLTSAQCRQVRY